MKNDRNNNFVNDSTFGGIAYIAMFIFRIVESGKAKLIFHSICEQKQCYWQKSCSKLVSKNILRIFFVDEE